MGTLTAPFANYYSINNTNYNLYRGLVNFDYSPSNNSISFFISVYSKGFTSVSFAISTSNPASVLSFTIRYMVIDISNFGGNFMFRDVNYSNFALNSGNPTEIITENPPGGNLFGNSNVPYIYCVIVMLDMVDDSNSNNYEVDMKCEVINPAKYKVIFNHIHDATYYLVGVSTIVIDKTYVESTFNLNLEQQFISFDKNSSFSYVSHTSFSLLMEKYSSFLGLSAFHSVSSASVRFDTFLDYSNQEITVFNTSSSS